MIAIERLHCTHYVDRAKEVVPEVLPDTPYYRWGEKPRSSNRAVVIKHFDRANPFGFHCPYEMRDDY
jgi:hypothetical protein